MENTPTMFIKQLTERFVIYGVLVMVIIHPESGPQFGPLAHLIPVLQP
jgi:hypothetical protein